MNTSPKPTAETMVAMGVKVWYSIRGEQYRDEFGIRNRDLEWAKIEESQTVENRIGDAERKRRNGYRLTIQSTNVIIQKKQSKKQSHTQRNRFKSKTRRNISPFIVLLFPPSIPIPAPHPSSYFPSPISLSPFVLPPPSLPSPTPLSSSLLITRSPLSLHPLTEPSSIATHATPCHPLSQNFKRKSLTPPAHFHYPKATSDVERAWQPIIRDTPRQPSKTRASLLETDSENRRGGAVLGRDSGA